MNVHIEQKFTLIQTASKEPLGITLQRFCQKTIVKHHRANLLAKSALERFELKTSAQDALLAMVILATEHCAETLIARKRAAGIFGNLSYRQKKKQAVFDTMMRTLIYQAEAALAHFQKKAVKDLYAIITRNVHLSSPAAITSAQWRAIAIMAYFFDIREQAELSIECALTTKVSK